MNGRNLRRVVLGLLLAAGSASAQILYWDVNGTNVGAGNPAHGIWDTTSTNFTTDPTGSSVTTNYTFGSDVIFSAGSDAATAAISVTNALTVGNLIFKNGTVVISGSQLSSVAGITIYGAAGPITISNAMSFVNGMIINASNNLTAGDFLGGASLIKTGTGTVTCTKLDGGFTVNQGLLSVSGQNKTKGGTINSGGTFQIAANDTIIDAYGVTVNAGGTLELSAGVTDTINTLTGDGTVTGGAGSVLTIGGTSGGGTFSGGLVGALAVAKVGTGTVTFSGTNSYSGGTTIGAGTLVLSGSLSNSSVTVSGGIFSQTVSGVIAGSGVSYTNSGCIAYLGGANTYDGGTLLNGGTQYINNASALGTGAFTINGGTLDNSSGAPLTNANANVMTWAGDFTFAGTANLHLGAGAVDLGTVTRTVTINANTLTVGGGITNNGSLTKAGAGTLVLAGANTYSGGTLIAGGMLSLSGTNSNSGGIVINGGTLKIDAGAGGALASGSAVTFGGTGAFNYDNTTAAGATAQNVALTNTAGEGMVQLTRTALQPVSLTLNLLNARATGVTRNYVLAGTPGVIGTDSAIVLTGQTAGFLDQGTFFGGTNYAWYDAGGYVRALAYGSDAGSITMAGGASQSSTNYLQITGNLTAQNTATFATLNIRGANNVILAGGQTVTVNGILKSGANAAALSGGAGIQAGTGAELVIRTDAAGDVLTIGTPIMANGINALTKSGAGTLNLTNANTYTGNTTINAGTLVVTNGGAINSPSAILNIINGTTTLASGGTITVQQLLVTNNSLAGVNSTLTLNGGTLTTSNTAGQTAANILVGFNVNYAVNGVWNMNGGINHVSSMQTNSTNSRLYIGNNIDGSAVTINPNAVLDLGNANGVNMLLYVGYGANNVNLTINGGVLTNAGNSSGFQIGIQGGANNGMIITNGGKVYASSTSMYIGTSSTSGSSSNTVTVTGGGSLWNNPGALYVGGVSSGSSIADNANGLIVANSGTVNIGGTFNIGGASNSVGNYMILTNGGQVTSANIIIIAGNAGANNNYALITGSGSLWNLSGKTLTIGVAAATGSYVQVSSGGVLTNGLISLGGVGSYVSFNGGTVAAGANGNLISGTGTGYVQSAGAIIDSAGFTVTNLVPLVQDPGSTGGGLTKLGTGTLVLVTNNTYTGTTLINVGTLQIGAGGTSGSLAPSSAITNNATLAFNRSDAITQGVVFASAIAGSGGVAQSGAGTLVLSGVNTYSGGTVLSNGTLNITNDFNLGAVPGSATTNITFSGSSKLQAGANLTLNNNRTILINSGVIATFDTQAYTQTVNGVITSASTNGSLTKIGTGGVLNLMGNTILSNLSVNGGTLALSGNTNTIRGALTVGNISGTPAALFITNGAQVQVLQTNVASYIGNAVGGNSNSAYVGLANNGFSSIWNVGSNALYMGQLTSTGNWLMVDNGGSVTSAQIRLGNAGNAVGNYMIITNGGQVSSYGAIFGRGNAANSNWVYVGGNNATWNLGNSYLSIGGYDANGTNDVGNYMLVDQGGVVTNATTFYVGASSNSVGNYMVITNGGQVFSKGTTSIGVSAGANSNWVFVGGSPGVGTNALWNLGSSSLTIGGAAATGNWLTVSTGGILTNGSVTLGGVSNVFNLAGDAYVSNVNLGATSAQMYFTNGSVLHANATGNLLSGTGTNYLTGSGGTIDSSTFTITNAVANISTGSLTKIGSGWLVLTGTNSYSGGTVINAGSLLFANTNSLPGSGNVLVNLGGALVATTNGTPTLTASNWLANTRLNTASSGTLALAYSTLTTEQLNFNTGNYSNLSLGAASGYVVTNSAVLTPYGSTYRLGGGGGTLVITNNLTAGTSLSAFSGGSGGIVILGGSNGFSSITLGNIGVLQVNTNLALGSVTNGNLVVPFGGTLAAGYAMDTNFVNSVSMTSAGILALAANSANNLNFSALTNVSLGAANGTWTNSGVITPYGDTYRLGGGGGTLVITNNAAAFTAAGTNLITFGSGSGGTLLFPVASNASFAINGNWTMQGGTNRIASVQTNGTWGTNYIGNGVSGAAVNVNSNAVWSLGTNATGVAGGTGNVNLVVGYAAGGSNNTLQINGGLVTNVSTVVLGGAAAGAIGNQMIITNGGRLYIGNAAVGSPSGTIGASANSNSVVIAGTNSAGGKATWDLGGSRLVVGAGGNTGNWIRVDQGGLITNFILMSYGVGSSVIITNGGLAVSSGSAGYTYVGRAGSISNSLIVAGADGSGTKATLNNNGVGFNIAGNGNAQTGNWARVDQGGIVTNVTGVFIGGQLVGDINEFGNYLVITNGGQFFSRSASTIGYSTNDNSNWAWVGGSPGAGTNALWDLGNSTLLIGASNSTNNYMTVAAGGVVTNFAAITVGADATAFGNSLTNSGGTLFGGTVVVTTNNSFILNNGGVATLSNVTLNATSSVFTVAGGTLVARANGNLVSGTGSMTLGAGGLTNNPNGFSVTDSVAIGGSGNLVLTGPGTLFLSASNSYSGGTRINAGTLYITNDFNLGATSGALILNSGTLSNNAASVTLSSSRSVQLDTAGGTVAAGGNTLTFSSSISDLVAGTGGPLIIGAGNGNVSFTKNNTYSGGTILQAGASLLLTSSASVSNFFGTGTLTLNGGKFRPVSGSLDVTITNAVSLAGGVTNDTSGAGFADWRVTFSGPVTLTNGSQTVTVNSTNLITISGKIGDNGQGLGFVKAGPGVLLLSGTNTYTGGTVVQTGPLMLTANYQSNLASTASITVQAAGAIGTTGAVDNNFLNWLNTEVVSSGTIVTGAVLSGASMAGGLTFSNTLANAFLGAYGTAINVTNGVTWSDTTIRLGGGTTSLTYLPAIAGATNLLLGPVGGNALSTVILTNAANSYTGGTLIQSGTLQLGNGGTATNTLLGNTSWVTNNSTLAFNFGSGTGATYTNSIAGSGALVSLGAGTLTLSASNTYSGGTLITGNNSTLALGANNALPTTGTLTLGDTTGVGTVNLANFNQTVSRLIVASTNANLTNTIVIGPSQTLTVNGTGTNFLLGIDQPVNITTKLVVTGGGTLMITNGSYFEVGHNSNGNNGNTASMDFSGLGTFTLTSTGTVHFGNDSSGTTTGNTTFTLATNSTITAATLTVNEGGGGGTSKLLLGAGTNTINVNNFYVDNANRGTIAQVYFYTNSGSLKLRGTDGISGANLSIGAARPANTGTHFMDLTGHNSDLLLNLLTVGENNNSGTVTAGNIQAAYFSFDTGTLTATTVRVGYVGPGVVAADAGSTLIGTNNIGGGTVNIGAGGLALAQNLMTNSPNTGTVFAVANIYGGAVVTIGADTNGNSIAMVQGSGTNSATLNLTGGTITLSGNITKIGGTGVNTATLTLNGGTLNMTGDNIGDAVNPIDTLNFLSGTLMNVGQINGGTTPLTKVSAGTLVLSNNTYTGGTIINNGILVANSASALGSGTVAITNALLQLQQSLTISNLSGASTASIDLGAGGTVLTVNQGGDSIFAGIITNAGGLTKQGVGTLTLTNTSTYSGATTINSGTLKVANGGSLSSNTTVYVDNLGIIDFSGNIQTIAGLTGNGVVTNGGGNLTVNLVNATNTFGGTLTGASTLKLTGGGTLIMTGTNSFSGASVITNGSTYVVNGLHNGALITAYAGSTVGGNGPISGTLLVNGGTYQPGYGSVLTQAVATLILTNSSTLAVTLAQTNNPAYVTVSSQLTLAGTNNYLRLSNPDSLSYTAGTITLVDYRGTGVLDFTNNYFRLADNINTIVGPNDGWALTNNMQFSVVGGGSTTNLFTINYDDLANGVITLTAVPEPGTASLLGLIGVAFLVRRLRRRQKYALHP